MSRSIKLGYGSPRWSGELVDCSMPMCLDTYSLCSFGCLYCFANFQRDTRGHGNGAGGVKRKVATAVDPERVKDIFLQRGDGKMVRDFGPYVRARRVMQWGGLSDQFDHLERVHGVTLELMRFFREIRYPISFSTKGTWWLKDPRYTELLAGSGWHLKLSIITDDEAKARVIEAGVTSPGDRLKAIELARKHLEHVTLRLRPFIIGLSNPSHVRLIREAAARGADSVSTEFMCLEERSVRCRAVNYPRMSQVIGYDIREFYKRHSRQKSGYLRLSRGVKRRFVDEMQEECERHGMRFHVSDADFKERGAHGCCCGLPEDMPWSRGQWTQAVMIARERGEVRWSDIGPELQRLAGHVEFQKNNGVNKCGVVYCARFWERSLYDWVRTNWNEPRSKKSPVAYFGGLLLPSGVDGNGDVIYRYNRELAEEGAE